jgi:hypothetical protein
LKLLETNFDVGCKKLGMRETDLFSAGDLLKQRNPLEVVRHLQALARLVEELDRNEKRFAHVKYEGPKNSQRRVSW